MPSSGRQLDALVGRLYGLKPTPMAPTSLTIWYYCTFRLTPLILPEFGALALMQVGLLVGILVSVQVYHKASLRH